MIIISLMFQDIYLWDTLIQNQNWFRAMLKNIIKYVYQILYKLCIKSHDEDD